MKTDFKLQEKEFATAHTAHRIKKSLFTANYACKIGLNILSKILWSVTNMMEKDWLEIIKESI